jgi:hypothetical protein
LIFSTRHLNATPEKRNFAEKFNTCVRLFAASHSFAKLKIAPGNNAAGKSAHTLRVQAGTHFARTLND